MTKINKTDLIREVTKATGLKAKDVSMVIDDFIKITCDHLTIGNEVSIPGFIKITPRMVNERSIHNLDGGTSISPAHKVLKAKISRALNRDLNEN
jgi:nucleoid DNA-binding protein